MKLQAIALRAVSAALFLTITAGSASAQDYNYSVSLNGGGIQFGDLNDKAGPDAVAITPTAGWVAGVQAEYWKGAGGRLGLRVNAAYSRRPVAFPADRERTLAMGFADIGALLRLLAPSPERTITPYIGIGVGAVHYGLGSGETVQYPTANAEYRGSNRPRPAVVGSFGIDVLTKLRWDDDKVGIRIEIADHVAKSPFEPMAGSSFGPVHNMRLTIGIFTGVLD